MTTNPKLIQQKNLQPQIVPTQYEAGAEFDIEKKYRFLLWRKWKWGDMIVRPKMVNFIMLNPSTADAETNDPTVERCQRRAQMMGYDGVYVTNLFAYRATDPKALKKVLDPVGKGNDKTILSVALASDMVIYAWGAGGHYLGRDNEIMTLLRTRNIFAYAIARNSDGAPKHPLYTSYELQPTLIENNG